MNQPQNLSVPTNTAGNPICVLIVDSHKVMSRILSHMLVHANLTYAVAQGGQDAIEFCKDTNYDMILMEVNMVGMNGMVATREIRKLSGHYSKIPIVAISTHTSERDILLYREAGMDAELRKPVNEVNLRAVLKEKLGTTPDLSNRPPPDDEEIYAILDKEELSLVNWEILNEYRRVMKGDYLKMMREYLRASPGLIGEMGEAVIGKKSAQVELLANQLKSTSQVFGADSVSNIAAELEILGRNGELEHAGQFYKELHLSFERIQPVLLKKLVLMKNMN